MQERPHRHRTRTPTSSQHIVAPLTHLVAQQNLPICGHVRLQARHRPRWRGCHGRATPFDGRRLLPPHGRAALRDTTVPNSRWHGVSGRGASRAWLPKLLAQHRPATLCLSPPISNQRACGQHLDTLCTRCILAFSCTPTSLFPRLGGLNANVWAIFTL